MSVLCSKCNAAVSEGAQFCGSCGAPVGAQPAAPVSGYTPVNLPPPASSSQTPPPPASATPPLPGYTQVNAAGQAPPPAAPPYSAVGAPPPSMPPPPVQGGGNTALKIVLIVIAVFVGIGIIGAGAFGYMVWRVSHAIRTAAITSTMPDGTSGAVTMNTPAGTITTGPATSFTADELGTDIYPGAQTIKGGMKMNLPSGSMVTGVFTTSDTKDAVRDFYKGKLGSGSSLYDTDDGAVLTAKRGDQESVMVTISAKHAEDDGKTRIVIVHTKASKSS